jgi:hypothetical protein
MWNATMECGVQRECSRGQARPAATVDSQANLHILMCVGYLRGKGASPIGDAQRMTRAEELP